MVSTVLISQLLYGSKMHERFLNCLNVFAYLFNPMIGSQCEYYAAGGLFLFLDVTETCRTLLVFHLENQKVSVVTIFSRPNHWFWFFHLIHSPGKEAQVFSTMPQLLVQPCKIIAFGLVFSFFFPERIRNCSIKKWEEANAPNYKEAR